MTERRPPDHEKLLLAQVSEYHRHARHGPRAVGACRADRQNTLNMYAWADYFPQSVIQKFQADTGIHINYAVFDSPDAAETALSVGNSNYDIVTMNAVPHLAREIPQGFWKQLDQRRSPMRGTRIRKSCNLMQQVDPGNTHAVPWMWGTTGIIYNADKAKALLGEMPANSLDMILKKEIAQKFERCGISILDSWQDILPMVARYLGQPNSRPSRRQFGAVVAKLQEIRPFLRRIATAGYYEQLADGD